MSHRSIATSKCFSEWRRNKTSIPWTEFRCIWRIHYLIIALQSLNSKRYPKSGCATNVLRMWTRVECWDCRLSGLWHHLVSYGVINVSEKTTVSIVRTKMSGQFAHFVNEWVTWQKLTAVSTSLSFVYLPGGNTSKLNLDSTKRGRWYNFHNGFVIQTTSR